MAENPTIDDLKAPLLAALGAADLALATVNDLLAELRERAEETRTDTRSRVEESRARLTKLQEDVPEQLRELRERFTADELRSAAEGYVEAATSRYAELVERGEAALERLRSQSGIDDASARAEGYVDQAVELTQEALGTVASQTRAVGERAAKLVGIELPKKTDAAAKKAQKAVAKKAPACPARQRGPAHTSTPSCPVGRLGVDVSGAARLRLLGEPREWRPFLLANCRGVDSALRVRARGDSAARRLHGRRQDDQAGVVVDLGRRGAADHVAQRDGGGRRRLRGGCLSGRRAAQTS